MDITSPPLSNGNEGLPRAVWMEKLRILVNGLVQSGTTANRPTTGLFIGRTYFDTTLTRPIWVKQIGTVLWCDATGTTV